MSPERWRNIEELYHAALELAAGERPAFLNRACGSDDDLRLAVEALLANGERAGSFLERPALDTGTKLPSAEDLLAAQVGAYRIVSQLGAGGMGDVYRAHDNQLGRDVAIKTLPREFARDPARLSRFRREARVLASFNHPNIAAIYGLEECGGSNYLVLELVEGETLRERIDRTGPLLLPEALNICCQVVEALEAAHTQGIVHRDLKPANIKVTPQGRVKVLDFGLAKAVWGEEERQDLSRLTTTAPLETAAGQILGTPPYMSPEQARGNEVDKRTDIWAFGCLLYELLTGKRAFAGEALPDTIGAILAGEPDWNALPAATPARIRELLGLCLQKNADRRPQNVADIRREIEEVQAEPGRRRVRGWILAAVSIVTLAIVFAAAVWMRGRSRPADRSEWTQLTHFSDSVSQPALSPDGRMLAFVRGPDTFAAPGQVYVKRLPDGEARQLTNDEVEKMSPVFSPDGAQIAYSVIARRKWDTWVVPAAGGQARLWLTNASGLLWVDTRRLLFSEIKNNDIHMGIVAAREDRTGARDLYIPPHERGMAHRSYPSPDGKWVLLAEMDRSVWLPCRLAPMDGSSAGRPVGPASAGCTFAAWSRDGRWMYLSSKAGGVFHTWRQRFPDGQPEQITWGPTEEEGVAMAPDGSSFVTAVALKQSSVWIHDATGERQISVEGYSFDPQFTPDGKKLCYRIAKGTSASTNPGELWMTDLESGHRQSLLPGIHLIGGVGLAYDISPDGRQIVAAAQGSDGKHRLWIAALEPNSAPRRLTEMEGDQPKFERPGEILFRHVEPDGTGFLFRVREDGTGLSKAVEHPIVSPRGVTPDHQWFVARVKQSDGTSLLAIPTRGGPPLSLCDGGAVGAGADALLKWSGDRRVLFISYTPHSEQTTAGRTYAVPLPPERVFPEVTAGGLCSEAEIAKLPAVRRIELYDVTPGPRGDVYAFSRQTVQRNLYRIPL
jgi:eukaryotic-like serine/threonine-protein kinase